jgi:hypothetical protein
MSHGAVIEIKEVHGSYLQRFWSNAIIEFMQKCDNFDKEQIYFFIFQSFLVEKIQFCKTVSFAEYWEWCIRAMLHGQIWTFFPGNFLLGRVTYMFGDGKNLRKFPYFQKCMSHGTKYEKFT